MTAVAQEEGVVGIRDLTRREVEGIDPDAVYGALVARAVVRSHREPGAADANELAR